MPHREIAVLYHADCPDGFGGAYAAWKKFGDAAEYLPVEHGFPPPPGISGKRVFVIDFAYPKPVMDELARASVSFAVLDHHEGMREAVEAMPEHVYNSNHSGATIAWGYFHPETPVPLLLKYVEDGDLYRFALPDARAIRAYAYTQPFTFESWDALARRLEDPAEYTRMREQGEAFVEYGNLLMQQIADRAWPVSFAGYEPLAVDAPRAFASDVGHLLAQRKPPLGIVIRAKRDGLRISLRGDGSIDVAAIARKYGGNGHPNAAAFAVPAGQLPPFTPIEHDDHPRH